MNYKQVYNRKEVYTSTRYFYLLCIIKIKIK